MKRLIRWVPILGFVVLSLMVTACASSGALKTTQQDLAAAQVELTKTKADLASAGQQVATLEVQLKEAEQAIDTVSKDGASTKSSLGTLQSDQTRLRSELSTASADISRVRSDLGAALTDVTRVKTDLTTTSSSLGDLKNSFLLTRDEVSKLKDDLATVKENVTALSTPDRASLAILAHNMYTMALQMNFLSTYSTVAVRVGDTVSAIHDSSLTTAWNKLDADYRKVFTTAASAPERTTVVQEFFASEDTFLLRLNQIIWG